MKELQKYIKKFKKYHDYQTFEIIMDKLYPEANKCKKCCKHILYKDTRFKLDRETNKYIIYGKSFKSKKAHGETLEICENCLENKFLYYNKDKRYFNTLNEITLYAFNIKNKELYKTGVTKEKLINKYGEKEGIKRWEIYLEKQANSNKLEYKKEKYGWTEKQFKEFNKSRATTLENLINRYGEKEGIKRWEIYLEKQKETKSIDYMIKKFGKEKTKEINKSKGLTLKNFQRKYGNEIGIIKYEDCINKVNVFYSKISQEFFNKIDKYFNKKYTTYYADKNIEFGVYTKLGYKRLDYFIKELNICIEFNGDIFHANPHFFNKNDKPNPFNTNITAEEIWINDRNRYDILKKERNITTIVVWEEEYKNKQIKEILKEKKLWNFILMT